VTTGAPRETQAVWAAAANDVWIVGLAGLVMHWDGQTWSDLSIAGGPDLGAVWRSPQGSLWALALDGRLLRH